MCVRERHLGDRATDVVNDLVGVRTDGDGERPAEPALLAEGHDFYAAPRLSPDGRRLAWLSWDHPRMPWDGTELRVGDLGALDDARLVAGGVDESVIDPQWSPDGALHYCSDRTGWWNLYREDGEALTSLEGAEMGFPAWVFAMRSYEVIHESLRIDGWAFGRGLNRSIP